MVPKSAKNPDAAKEFIKFVLTEQVQQDIVTRGQNMAARVGVKPPDVLPDMEEWFQTSTKLFKPYDGVQADFPRAGPLPSCRCMTSSSTGRCRPRSS